MNDKTGPLSAVAVDPLVGRSSDSASLDDLAMLVRKLAHALKKSDPDNDLARRALDYLKRKGLQGRPLR